MPRYKSERNKSKTSNQKNKVQNEDKTSFNKYNKQSKNINVGESFKSLPIALLSICKKMKNIRVGRLVKNVKENYYYIIHCFKKAFIRAFNALRNTSHFWLPACIFCFIFVLAIISNIYTIAVKVTDNGVVAFFENKEIYDQTKKSVETDVTNELGEQYEFDSEPTYSFVIVKKDEISKTAEVKSKLRQEADEYIGQTYALIVDGKLLGTYKKEESILDLLENIKKPYLTGDVGEKVEFLKKVEITKGMYPKSAECTIEELRNKLLIPDDTILYTVKKNDTAYSIAKKYNISVTRLKSLNPDTNLNNLTKGQEIYVSGKGTFLGIKVLRTIKYEEEIPYTTTIIKTDSLFENTTQVKSKGVNGIKEITADVVMIDGVETQRTITNKTVTRNPVAMQQLVGTKKIAPSGTFGWPVRGGHITSTFNDWRGSHYHQALDICAPTGTPIYAADGGTVYYAKRESGGYGLNIVIDHGSGVMTRYAHCSKLLVSTGQKVYKGQVIALVGSTGYATGSHCHFEVIKGGINGNRVDPLKYLK